uniref:SYS1 golgi trafficking protein n=1 Tax=Equus asinus TaxID=9793 RepID=A0A9L0K1S8_EQUAS
MSVKAPCWKWAAIQMKGAIVFCALGRMLVPWEALPSHLSSVFLFVIPPQILGFSTPPGRLSMMSFILNALTCALGLLYFIRRGKQCLDFTVTVHFFHLLGCWFYSSRFPSALTWWLVQIVCIALMAVIGEYLCMRTELKEIPLNSAPKSNV